MKNQSTTAIIALIISILALILAWTAFNRAGQDLTAIIEQEVQEAVAEVRAEYEEFEQEVEEATYEARDEAAEGIYEAGEAVDPNDSSQS